jgi:hypothetical protein
LGPPLYGPLRVFRTVYLPGAGTLGHSPGGPCACGMGRAYASTLEFAAGAHALRQSRTFIWRCSCCVARPHSTTTRLYPLLLHTGHSYSSRTSILHGTDSPLPVAAPACICSTVWCFCPSLTSPQNDITQGPHLPVAGERRPRAKRHATRSSHLLQIPLPRLLAHPLLEQPIPWKFHVLRGGPGRLTPQLELRPKLR